MTPVVTCLPAHPWFVWAAVGLGPLLGVGLALVALDIARALRRPARHARTLQDQER